VLIQEEYTMNIVQLLAKQGMTVSMSQGRRAVMTGRVSVDGKRVDAIDEEVDAKPGTVVKLGKNEKTI
jgi:predicted rRNA methylase YqxC with S4 and FtsJ domains